ncbi:hypothetical protein AZZ62_002404, partial [Klebsiella variicola]
SHPCYNFVMQGGFILLFSGLK